MPAPGSPQRVHTGTGSPPGSHLRPGLCRYRIPKRGVPHSGSGIGTRIFLNGTGIPERYRASTESTLVPVPGFQSSPGVPVPDSKEGNFPQRVRTGTGIPERYRVLTRSPPAPGSPPVPGFLSGPGVPVPDSKAENSPQRVHSGTGVPTGSVPVSVPRLQSGTGSPPGSYRYRGPHRVHTGTGHGIPERYRVLTGTQVPAGTEF